MQITASQHPPAWITRCGARLMLQVALEEEVMAFLQRDWHERRPGGSSWRNGSKLRTVKVAGGDGRSPCRKYAEREDRSTLGCFHLTSTGCGRWRRQFPSSTCMTSPPGGCKRPWASSGGSEAWVRRPWCAGPEAGGAICYLAPAGSLPAPCGLFLLGRGLARRIPILVVAHAFLADGRREVLTVGSRESTRA
jgi:hypothetical protein